MREYKKEIVKYENGYKYLILVPVFYECEEKPAWRNVFSGSLEECKENFSSFPDTMQASPEENKRNRHNMRLTADLWQSLGRYKAAAMLRKRYGF